MVTSARESTWAAAHRAGRSGRRWRPGAGLVRVVAVSAAVLLVAAGGIWAVTRNGGGDGSMQAVGSVDMARVERGAFSITTTSMGELEARKQIELRSELDARADIVEIVPEGTVAKEGDVLVRLNTEELQEQIDQQTLEVERALADVVAAENALKIQLSENESRERAGKLKLELAELALAQWRDGEVVKTRAQHKLDIEQAERNLRRLREKFERSEQLLAKGFVSQDERDQDEIAFINAQATLETALLDQQTYEEYQFPRDEKTKVSDVDEANADLDRIRTQNDINAAAKESSLETSRRQYELKKERLEKLREQVELATIRAPTSGLVVYATSIGDRRGDDEPLEVGREVRPNELLIILPNTSSLVANVRVHESLAGRVRSGQPAQVRVDAIGGRMFMGTVESVGVLAESGGWRDPNRREYTVRIGLDYDNTSGDLKPSMRAEAEIVLGMVNDSLMAPVQSIFSEGPVKFVYTPQGGKFARVPVQVGRMSDTSAEILAGVEPGTPVLLRRPGTGEVMKGEWSREQLESVGVALDEDGNPIGARAGRAEMMRMMQERSRQQGGERSTGRPGGSGAQSEGPAQTGEAVAAESEDARGAAGEATEVAGGEAGAPVEAAAGEPATAEPAAEVKAEKGAESAAGAAETLRE